MTWSSWSHCAIVTPEGTVIEAVYPRVREVTLAAYLDDNGVTQIEDMACHDPAAAAAWARAQVGKRYDLAAVLGLAFRRIWTDPRQWFCSELVAMAFEEGGSPLVKDFSVSRVTPQDLWEIPTA